MYWQLAFGVSIILGVARILAQRRYAQSSTLPATIPPALSYVCGVLPIGLIAGLFIFPHQINWSLWVIILMAVLSISMAVSNWLGFVTAKKLAVASQKTISMVTNVVVVLLGWTLLGERLTTAQFVGGGVLLAAAVIAIRAPVRARAGEAFKQLEPRTVIIAMAAAVLLAIGLVTEKALLRYMDIGGIFLVSWTAQCLGMVALAAKDVRHGIWNEIRGHELRWSALLGLSNGVQGALYVYAIFYSNNISLITVIGTLSLPLMVFGAYIFLREREHHRLMWISIALSCVGLLVISLLQ